MIQYVPHLTVSGDAERCLLHLFVAKECKPVGMGFLQF